jgi:hypothetical protein
MGVAICTSRKIVFLVSRGENCTSKKEGRKLYNSTIVRYCKAGIVSAMTNCTTCCIGWKNRAVGWNAQ